MSEARAECVVATNLPPGNKIVETCARGMAPDIYQQLVARDDAERDGTSRPLCSRSRRFLPIEAVSPVIPSLPAGSANSAGSAVQPDSPPVNLSSGPGVPEAGLPFGTRTLVYGPNGGLEVSLRQPLRCHTLGFLPFSPPSVRSCGDAMPRVGLEPKAGFVVENHCELCGGIPPGEQKRFALIWTEYDCTATTRQSARLVLWRSGET